MEAAVLKKLENFFGQFKSVNYKKNEIILRAGEPIFGVFYLKKGYVRQYIISEEGEEVTIHIYQPPAFFPTMLVINSIPNRYYFEAETVVETRRADPGKVVEFLETNPDVLFDLASRFADAVVGLSRRIETLAIGNTYAKVLSLIDYLNKRFGETEGKTVTISLPVTHNDIAAWVGAKRETVSRQIEKMIKKELIEHKHHLLVIKNKTKFADELKEFQGEEE